MNRLNSRFPIYGIFIIAALFLPAVARSQAATIVTRPSATQVRPGDEFRLTVQVEDNETGQIPVFAAFRLTYDSRLAEFLGTESGDLGTVGNSTVEGEAPANNLDIATLSNPFNSDPTPTVYTISFRALEQSISDQIDFQLSDDPGASTNLGDQLLGDIPHEFDNSFATVSVSPDASTPTPTVTPTPEPTPSPSPTSEPTPSPSPTPEPTPSPSPTPLPPEVVLLLLDLESGQNAIANDLNGDDAVDAADVILFLD